MVVFAHPVIYGIATGIVVLVLIKLARTDWALIAILIQG